MMCCDCTGSQSKRQVTGLDLARPKKWAAVGAGYVGTGSSTRGVWDCRPVFEEHLHLYLIHCGEVFGIDTSFIQETH